MSVQASTDVASPFSIETQRLISDVTDPVSSGELDAGGTATPDDLRYHSTGEIDAWVRYKAAQDKSHRLRTMLDTWKEQQGEERRLRSKYAGWLLFGLFVELIVASAAFFLMGSGCLTVNPWVADAFFVGVFGQVASMVLTVVRYLFPDRAGLLPELIERL